MEMDLRAKYGIYAKSGYRAVKDRAIQFTDDVRSAFIPRDDDKGPDIARPHLMIERLLDGVLRLIRGHLS